MDLNLNLIKLLIQNKNNKSKNTVNSSYLTMVLKKILTLPQVVYKFGVYSTLKMIFRKFYIPIKLSKFNLKKEYQITVNNYEILTMPNDKGISSELLVFRVHEPLHTELLSRELKKGMVCLDIGANIGYYALLENNKVGNTGKVIAIEPSPINFKQLKKNIMLQENSNVEVHNFACGNYDGFTKFSVSEISNWSRIVGEKDFASDEILSIVDIPIKKIDSFLETVNLSTIDIIRMDVEGYECQVIEGMLNTIYKYNPLLVLEFHTSLVNIEDAKKILIKLKKMGYKIKYYFHRELDLPMLSDMKNVQSMDVNMLIQILDNPSFSKTFTVFFSNRDD